MDQNELLSRITKIKKEHEQAKTEKNRLEGGVQKLEQTLKESFGCETIEQAKEKQNQLNTRTQRVKGLLETKVADLESQINKAKGIT